MPLPSRDGPALVALVITRGSATEPWTRWHVFVQEAGDGQPLCLALTNTRNWRHSASPLERLTAYVDVVHFARVQKLLDEAAAARLVAHADRHPRAAQAELASTVALREAMFRVFAARSAGAPLSADDVALVTASFNAAVAGLALDLRDGALVPRTRAAQPDLDDVRLQCALSAVALLTSPRADKVKMCADDRGCGWLFVDQTRNGSRRFCFSNECGNRARQAAFRARHRHEASATAR